MSGQEERDLIGVLLAGWREDWPSTVKKVLRTAPKSFHDLRYGKVAAAIRDLGKVAGSLTVFQHLVAKRNGKVVANEWPETQLDLEALTVENCKPAELDYFADRIWTAARPRLIATVYAKLAEDLLKHPDRTEELLEKAKNKAEAIDNDGHGGLPQIMDSADLVAADFAAPVELVAGILHRGSKLALGGGSKSFKTWVLTDLALSVAYGVPWMGRATLQSRVLYINLEIQPAFFARRLERVGKSKSIEQVPGNLDVWNLRGHPAAFHELLSMIQGRGYDLIILDPIYKLYGLADENKASDVARLLNGIEGLTVQTGAAAVWGSHFSKGNQSGKESIDRISGSGVFARDPDSLLIMTPHQDEECFTIEPTLRNFPTLPAFVVRWRFPLMVPAPELNPGDLKKPGPKPKYEILDLLAHIENTSPENPVSLRQWSAKAKVPRKTLDEYVTTMRERRWVATVGDGQNARKFITPEGKNALG